MASITTLVKTTCSLVLLFTAWMAQAHSGPGVFNVLDFGAVADGKKDCAKAFLSAWNEAYAWRGRGRGKVLIPQGTFLASTVFFKGPCKGKPVIQLQGVVKAPVGLTSDDWIVFAYVNGLTVSGRGKFDGQGALAWSKNKCSKGGKCKFPVNLRFNFVTNATIRGISSVDSKYFHINILGSKDVTFQNIKISAPDDSLNTDGIHIGRSTGIKITQSVIATGDDCISLGDGSHDISISTVFCEPGHGISIGSLGKYDKEEPVFGVSVKNCTLTGTENGVRIKTWPASFSSMASNFTFEDIVMNNVKNPIVIDQQYCPYNLCNLKLPSLVKIKDVIFKNIRGTSASKLAVNLLCSKGVPCQGVELCDINLKYNGNDGPIISMCSNVKAILFGKVFPPTCV